MTAVASPLPPSARRISRLSVGSWVLYDLANTIFSINIVSLYFSLWVVSAMGATDQAYGNANGLSMLLMFLSAPVLGALSDQAPRRLPFLAGSTAVCVGFTLLLGTGGLLSSLIFFVIANYFYQGSQIFYDSLLPEVSTEENRGRVGGLGVGIGYFGSIIGITMGMLLLPEKPTPGDYTTIFRVTGLLFLVFALPAFFLIRERPRRVSPFGLGAVRRAFVETRQTVQRARQYRGLARFLFGRVFYTDAANTLIVFMGIYVTQEMAFSTDEAQLLLLASIPAAVVGGLVAGVSVDRFGPKRTLNAMLLLWMVVLSLTIAIPVLDLTPALFWVVGSLAGVALGGTWSADRPYMLRLAPPRYLGQFYGLYAMVGRFSAIIGPLLWGFVVNTLDLGRPAAVASLLALLVVGYVILQGISDEPRPWSVDELAPE